MQTKISVTLPLRDNRGRSLRRQVAAIKSEMLSLAGGVSVYRVRGAWRADHGRIYRDTSDVAFTIVDDALAAKILADYVPVWTGLLRQECVLVVIEPVQAHFVEAVA